MPPEIDRGDDFTPTPDPAAAAAEAASAKAAQAAADASALEAEAAAKKGAAKDDKKPAAAAAEADVDPDADPDADPEAAAAAAAAKAAAKKDTRIPLARHKELLDKERAARQTVEAQLAQYQNGKVVADLGAELTAAEKQIVDLEKEFAKHTADGEVEKAAAAMTQIRQLERSVNERKSEVRVAAAEVRAIETTRYSISLERVEAAYPQLNPDSDSFDEELMGDVADLKVTYERKGMTPTDALQRAVKKLVPAATAKQEDAVDVTPRVDAKAAADKVAAERKKAAVEKTLAATAATPPNAAKVGMDSDKEGGTISAKDVLKMSFKDFSALKEEDLARMRGDAL